MRIGQGGTEVCTCVWVSEELRCVHVYGSGGTEVSICVYVRD